MHTKFYEQTCKTIVDESNLRDLFSCQSIKRLKCTLQLRYSYTNLRKNKTQLFAGLRMRVESMFSTRLEGPKRSKFTNRLSKCSRTSLHNHR